MRQATVRNAAFDALWHQLVFAEHIVLEIAVLAVALSLTTRLHCTQRTHSAVSLELLAIHERDITWRFIGAR